MHHDEKITTCSDDWFDRIPFVETISDVLILSKGSPSLAIGLEGTWGVGKTSTITMIKETILNKHQETILVDFNPWIIGNLDSIVNGFLIQLASAIDRDDKSLDAKDTAKKILNLARFITPIKLIPGVEPWGSLVQGILNSVGEGLESYSMLSELDLLERKQKVEESITKLGKSIVVFIDDIDRLPPHEVRTLFQTVKAIGDFKRVSYLLAYDPDPVAKALEYENIYNGRKYLEKIVQSTYTVPRVGYWHLKTYLYKLLDEMINTHSINEDHIDRELLNLALSTTAIVRTLETPRDAARLVNKLSIPARTIAGEVCFADIIAFETLALKYPTVANCIRKNPEYFIKEMTIEGEMVLQDHIDEVTRRKAQDGVPRQIDETLKKHGEKDLSNIKSILRFIFPKTSTQPMVTYADEDITKSSNRISNRTALLTLLHCGLSKFNFSRKEARHFVENKIDRREIFTDKINHGIISRWASDLQAMITNNEITGDHELCLDLIELQSFAHLEHEANILSPIGDLMLSIMYKFAHKEHFATTLNAIMQNQTSISLSEYILLELLGSYDTWELGKLDLSKFRPNNNNLGLSASDLNLAINTWSQAASRRIANPNFLAIEIRPLSILFRITQLNQKLTQNVKDILDTTANNPPQLEKFINLFANSSPDGLEELIGNIDEFISSVRNSKSRQDLKDKITNHLANIRRKT